MRLPAVVRQLLRQIKWLVSDCWRYVRFRCPDSRGIFDNFAQAAAAAPRNRPVGYNDNALAVDYRQRLTLAMHSYDYPVLFHLDRLLRTLARPATLLDYGGNVGVHFLRLRPYLDLSEVQWVVCDVPAITAAGREACSGIDGITFIEAPAQWQATAIDVLLICGALQYVESPESLLKQLSHGVRPRHVLIDQVCVSDSPTFVTLQNGGLVYYPEYVFNRTELLQRFAALGYRLQDCWDCDQDTTIPFHRDRVLRSHGMYFIAEAAVQSRRHD